MYENFMNVAQWRKQLLGSNASDPIDFYCMDHNSSTILLEVYKLWNHLLEISVQKSELHIYYNGF